MYQSEKWSTQKKRWVATSILFLWSILTASFATGLSELQVKIKKTVLSASYVTRQGAIPTNQWTFAQTSPWIAVGNVIIVLAHIPYVSTIYRRSICTVLGE